MEKLNQVLRNNTLSFYKGIDIWLDDKIMTKGTFQEKETKFKDNKMQLVVPPLGVVARLPDYWLQNLNQLNYGSRKLLPHLQPGE